MFKTHKFSWVQPPGIPLSKILLVSYLVLASAHLFAAPGDILFEEYFNNNGDFQSDWSEAGAGDVSVNGQTFSSPSNSLRLGEGNVSVTSDAGNINAAGVGGAEVSVWIRRGDDSFSENPDAGEDLLFEYLNNANTWIELDTYPGDGAQGEIFTPTFTLPADALHSNLRLRFTLVQANAGNFDYWHIDDVIVRETGAVGGSCDTYADNFNTVNYNNSDGTLNWSGNSWVETNDNGSPNNGDLRISGGVLQISGNGSYLFNTAITRQADTSGADSITLSFDFAMRGGVDLEDGLFLEVSSDGGANWDLLELFYGFNNNATGSRSYTITSYASSDMQVRFRLPFDYYTVCCFDSGNERMEVDNFTIEVCGTQLPQPVAAYYFDEISWTGTPGEVIDSSVNGLHGEAVNLNGFPDKDNANPAIAGEPGTCGYGIFNGANDGYVEIPDPGNNSLLDFADNFSVSAWIYPLSYATSDLATIVSKDTNYEFHLNGLGQVYWWWGGGNEQVTSTNPVTLNAWNHVTITYQTGQQKVYINGVESGSSSSTAGLNQNNNSLFIGTDLNYHTRRFNGYIDEVNVFDTALTAAQVIQVMDLTHTCPVSLLSHYAIQNSGAGVTCESELVTIAAHDDTHAGVDADSYTIQVSATSATPGWSANDVTWSLASGNGTFSVLSPGVAQYEFSGEAAVSLRLGNISEALVDIDVVDGLGNTDVDGDATEDNRIQFLNTGFLFYEDADANGVGDGPIISPLVAGGLSSNSIVRAVETDSNTGACIARLLGARNVDMAYECVNPSTCQYDKDLQINGTAIEENNAGAVAAYQAVPLTFDAQGVAPFQFEYFDVGQIRLHARINLPSDGEGPAITLQGSSNNSTVYPDDLVITSVQAPDLTANPGSLASGPGFVVAGTPFRVTVEARNEDGRITPNFGLEISPETLQLEASSLRMPVGGNLPALTSANSFTSAGALGVFINTSVAWPEAGTIEMHASTDDNYLDAGKVTSRDGVDVGRFYPEHFTLTGVSLIEGCAAGGFTYMSDLGLTYRPLQFNFSVNAVAGASVLTNYDQALGYPVSGFNVVAENNNSGVDLSSRAGIDTATFVSGVYQLNSGTGALARFSSAGIEAPDGPLSAVQFGLQTIGGADGVDFSSTSLNMNAAQASDCVSDDDCNAAALGSAIAFRFGRLSGTNAHGPESAALNVPLEVQYWNGAEFVRNTEDLYCTSIAFSEVRFAGNALNVDSNRNVAVGSGTSTGSFSEFDAGVRFDFVNGDAGLQFSAPGAGNTGSFYVDVDLTNYPFLRGDWDGDGNYGNETALPSIEVSFGRYRGHDRIIHWREVLN